MSVYFIQSGGPDGYIKIGYTAGSPEARMAALKTGNPLQLALLAVIPGDQSTERALHEKFKEFRGSGEWFTPAPRLMWFIDGLGAAFRRTMDGSEPTLFGLSVEQTLALTGYMKATLLCEEAERVAGLPDELCVADLLHATDTLERLNELLTPTVAGSPFSVGIEFNGMRGMVEKAAKYLQGAIDRHHEEVGYQIAEQRLVEAQNRDDLDLGPTSEPDPDWEDAL